MDARSRKDRATVIQAPRFVKDKPFRPETFTELPDELFCEGAAIEQSLLSSSEAADITFECSTMRRVSLDSSKLRNMRMTDLQIDGSNFANAEWRGATLSRVIIRDCRCTGLAFDKGSLREVVFKSSKADYIRFGQTKLKNVRFEACALNEADFQDAELDNVWFVNCDLTKADLSALKLESVDLTGSQIEGIKIRPERLKELTIESWQAILLMQSLGAKIV
jgi:uncharacterized protein YjbI with pentapeptide repeats